MHRFLLICLTCVIGLWSHSAAAELSIEGPCAQGHRWTATMINQGGGGIASYNECSPSVDMVYHRCTPGNRSVDFTIEVPFSNLPASDQLTADISVGNARYPVRGRATYSEMISAGYPTFTLDRSDPLFAALDQGSTASVTLAGTTFTMHLTGSADILSAMFEACP